MAQEILDHVRFEAPLGKVRRKRRPQIVAAKNPIWANLISLPPSPWQSPFVERLIGSIRRECLDPILTINKESLRATLRSYFSYYHDSRCHLELNKDSPEPGEIQLPDKGRIVEIPKVEGLHHRYERRAA